MKMIYCFLFLTILSMQQCIAKYTIDYESCKGAGDRKCYILSDCDARTSDPNILTAMDDPTQIKTGCTRTFGVQTKSYSDSKILVIIEMIGVNKMDKTKKPEISLHQNQKQLFGCKLEDGEMKVAGDEAYITKHKISLYDVSHWVEGSVVCACLFHNREKAFEGFAATDTGENMWIRYYEEQGGIVSKEIKSRWKGTDILSNPQRAQCNPDDLAESFEAPDFHVVPIPDKARLKIDCKGAADLTYKLHALKTKGTMEEINAVECGKDQYDDDVWKISKKDGTVEEIMEPELYTFHCGININRVCTPFPCSGSDCPTFSVGTDATPAAFNCANNKWLIKGEYHVGNQPACKARESKRNQAIFMITLSTGEEIVLPDTARCFDKYICTKRSRLEYSDCQAEECGILNRDENSISCQAGTPVRVQVRSSNTTMSSDNYKCDTTDGQWKDAENKIIPEGSFVSCEGKLKEGEAKFGDSEMNMVTVGVLAGTGIIGLISTIIIIVWLKHKWTKGGRPHSNWNKMKDEQRIKIATETYDKIFKPEYVNMKVTEGLTFFEKMIQESEDHPSVWEPILSFVARFHAVAMLLDETIHEKFSMFCLVQAKKIIDRHGWKNKKPSTNAKHEGYIRVVAMSLLGRALLAFERRAAEKLLMEGFNELRFNGDELYPLGGVIWSLVAQNRLNSFIDIDNPDVVVEFGDLIHALPQLVELYEKLPQIDASPLFGQIADQARVALIHHTKITHIYLQRDEFFKDVTTVEFLLKALCEKTYPAPERFICMSYTDSDGERPDRMSEFLEMVPEPHLSRIMTMVFQTLIFNSKMVDAKKLQMRCKLDNPEMNEKFAQMKSEQRRLEEAMNEERDDLTAWFAARKGVKQQPPSKNSTSVVEKQSSEAGQESQK